MAAPPISLLRPGLWWVVPLLAYCGLIYWLSSIQVAIPAPELHTDKLIHFLAYAAMAMMACQALLATRLETGTVMILATAFSVFYGASDEWHQSFVPGRMAGMDDWIADSLGGMVGTAVRIRMLRGDTEDR